MKYIKEIEEAFAILKMMRENMTTNMFGNRITTYTPKDTAKLRKKLNEPTTDKEREEHMKKVEPLMNRRQAVQQGVEPTLDRALDLDTRVSPEDYEPSVKKSKKYTDSDDEDDIKSQFNDLDISNLE